STQVHDSDGAIPDLVGTVGAQSPLIVEVKFRAGLTPAQPVKYIDRLGHVDESALLLFLVPRSRVAPIWKRLVARSADQSLVIEQHHTEPRGQIGTTAIGVTRWGEVLDLLDRAGAGEPSIT